MSSLPKKKDAAVTPGTFVSNVRWLYVCVLVSTIIILKSFTHNFQQGSNSFITVSLEMCSMSNSLDVAAHGILFLNILP